MRTTLIATCTAAICLMAGSAAALTPSADPLCDGVKKPTDDTEHPPKASTDPLCDGVKKPTDDAEHPPKASTEPLCDGVKKPTDDSTDPPKT